MRFSSGLSTSKSPCMDCTKRSVGCHGECGDYKDYSNANKQRSDKINFEKKIDHDIMSIKFYKKHH